LSTNPDPVVSGRTCGGCYKLIGATFDKPKGVWCEHCVIGVGVAFTQRDPNPALWLSHSPDLPEAWRLSQGRIVLAAEADGPLHQPFAGKADHLTQQLGVGDLLERARRSMSRWSSMVP
jgi:hypothetical protein